MEYSDFKIYDDLELLTESEDFILKSIFDFQGFKMASKKSFRKELLEILEKNIDKSLEKLEFEGILKTKGKIVRIF